MAANNIAETVQGKVQQAGKMSAGIVKEGSSIPITMVTKPQLDTAVTALKTTQAAFQGARQAKKEASGDYIPAAAGVRDFLLAARPVFVSSFGNRWSADWAFGRRRIDASLPQG